MLPWHSLRAVPSIVVPLGEARFRPAPRLRMLRGAHKLPRQAQLTATSPFPCSEGSSAPPPQQGCRNPFPVLVASCRVTRLEVTSQAKSIAIESTCRPTHHLTGLDWTWSQPTRHLTRRGIGPPAGRLDDPACGTCPWHLADERLAAKALVVCWR